MDFVLFTHSRSTQDYKLLVPTSLPRIPAVLTIGFLPHQHAVTIGMENSFWGNLEQVKTLLEMGLISIDDKDAVSLLASAHAFHLLARDPHSHNRSLSSHSTGRPHHAGLRKDL
jgi:hypothetical protein